METVGSLEKGEEKGIMRSWEINSFADPASHVLQLNSEAVIPSIEKSTDVLIKVVATSINPIDVYMARGYGAKAIQILRDREKGRWTLGAWARPGQQFPLRLGRDFAGIVQDVGTDLLTTNEFKVGDPVYGFVSIPVPGCHADFVIVDKNWIQKKPEFLSFPEAASIPYVALTTWSALRNAGNFSQFTNKNFLVLGGSGGVGTFAVQYLKAQGAKVTTTCSEDAIPMMRELGADFVIDYRDPDHEKLIGENGPYDCIFDLAGEKSDGKNYLRYAHGGKYITLTGPVIYNMDSYGLACGVIKSGFHLMSTNLGSYFSNRACVKWGYYTPDGEGWKIVTSLVADRKIMPMVEKIYSFDQLPQAYDKVTQGHLRGKIVVNICDPNELPLAPHTPLLF